MKKLLTLLLFVFLSNFAMAGDNHNNTTINNYTTEQTISNAFARSEVRAAAAGQTNYKATPRLQWNLGSAFSGGESALNFGLGYQAGSIFVTGSVTDNTNTMFTSDSDPLYTLNVGGVF